MNIVRMWLNIIGAAWRQRLGIRGLEFDAARRFAGVHMRHRLQVRVYYEDTDFSGRVYHASYLRFMERGRTEWLREKGFENASIASEKGLTFAVRSVRIEYLAPALMDDLLTVATEVTSSRGAIIEFEQVISRDETILTEASVRVVTLSGSRPARPPRGLVARRATT